MHAALVAFFTDAREDIAKQLAAALSKFAKSNDSENALDDAYRKRINEILANLDFSTWDQLPDDIAQYLVMVAKDGAKEAILQVGADEESLYVANEMAIAYARDRAAEMVGKKWVEDELVDNPDAQWVITDSTRELLRDDVTEAMEKGWSNDELAAALEDNYAFSSDRAEVIARTETARADVEGNLAAYQASGVVSQKEWLTAPDCCDDCQELNGVIVGLDEPFPGGDSGPPLHPQCRCDVLPVVDDESDSNSNEGTKQ